MNAFSLRESYLRNSAAKNIATNMRDGLISRFQSVRVNGAALTEALREDNFIAAVIDIDQKETKGIETPRSIRAQKIATPLIGVSSFKGEWPLQVAEFLDNGGDYLLQRPLNQNELDASITAASRRALHGQSESILESSDKRLKLNVGKGTVMYDGVSIRLTNTEASIFFQLVSHPGLRITREAILERNYDHTEIEDRSIDTHIKRIRQKLSKTAPSLYHLIKCEYGAGYYFEMP